MDLLISKDADKLKMLTIRLYHYDIVSRKRGLYKSLVDTN